MAAPDGFRLAEELRGTFLSYLTSALPIGNHQSQRELGKHFYQQWSSELFAGPLVEALPVYQKVGSLDDYFGDTRDKQSDDFKFAASMNVSLDWVDVDHRFPQYRKIRDAIWHPASDDAEEEAVKTSANRFWERSLYEHQWQSFEKVARQHRNLMSRPRLVVARPNAISSLFFITYSPKAPRNADNLVFGHYSYIR